MSGSYSIEVAKDRNKLYNSEYLKMMQFDKLNSQLELILTENANKFHPTRYKRLTGDVIYLKHRFTFDRIKTICISFRMFEHNITCAYGFVYGSIINDNFEPDVIIYGPSLTSQDGEYRSRSMLWVTYCSRFNKYKNAVDMVDEMICARLDNGQLSYSVDIHLDLSLIKYKSQIAKFIDDKRLAINVHILCWLYDFYAINNEYQENHMNPIYKYLFSQNADLAFLKKILETMSDGEYQTMQLLELSTIQYRHDTSIITTWPLKAGQKLFPLIVDEFEHPNDIRFPTWAELYITNRASNLVLNFVSPSFYFLGGWFLINNGGPELYDNEVSRDRFKFSNISSKITRKLTKARDNIDAAVAANTASALSQDFSRLAAQISRARTFARARLNLSNYSLCQTSEFVGRTLRDFYHLHNTGSYEASHHIFTDIRSTMKFVFDMIWAFHSANTRAHIIHGDPHVNNITLYQTFFHWDTMQHPSWSKGNAVTLYLDGNERHYTFPYTGEHTCLIDFSRAMLGDRDAVRQEFGEQIAREFFIIQDVFMANLIGHHVPQITVQEAATLINSKPATAFKLFAAIDPIISCRGFLQIITVEKIFKEDIAAKIIELLGGIVAFCEEQLMANLELARREPAIDDPAAISWINWEILGRFFSDYNTDVEKLKDLNIICTYNMNAEMINNIDRYENWGNHITYEQMRKVAIRDDTWKDMPNNRETYENLMRQLVELNKYEAEMATKEREYVEIEPWMFL